MVSMSTFLWNLIYICNVIVIELDNTRPCNPTPSPTRYLYPSHFVDKLYHYLNHLFATSSNQLVERWVRSNQELSYCFLLLVFQLISLANDRSYRAITNALCWSVNGQITMYWLAICIRMCAVIDEVAFDLSCFLAEGICICVCFCFFLCF